jgi:hypothetical protein
LLKCKCFPKWFIDLIQFYENLNNIFCRSRNNHAKVYVAFQGIMNRQNSGKNEEQNWSIAVPDFKTYYNVI